MDKREQLRTYLKDNNLSVPDYAATRGVAVSVIYKFLQGKDIRLSTWDSLDPAAVNIPACADSARAIA